ncbi:MAG: ribonuclease D [Candidatus Competibacteraceae bacterium]|nr:ribonuclease D [Candidatus Competibacteraceae bacterium]MCP5126808.1 ribonuclease D [Gammaproteobacteria bacterium]HRX70608.1 ribonuclease D [Candidatus Competibacteraceae bacterium]
MSDLLYIVDQPALIEFCAGLNGASWLALDTEFIREQTFYPQLCLIQIASADYLACIDPIALPSLEPLLTVLCNPAITKILHAAYQDLEIFHHLHGEVPAPVFDTQLAALVLGYGNQVGYANLVEQMLGVTLDKEHTRADWRRRPLPPEWLAYAIDDVRYLPELYRRQQAMLAERGWQMALNEDFMALTDPARYRSDPREAWRRVRDHQRLRGVQRAVLRALAAWREEQANRHDRPRRWILSDAILLNLAQRMPGNLEDLARIPGLPSSTLRQHGAAFLEYIAAARAEPPEQWPAPQPRRLRLTAKQAARVDDLLQWIADRASECSIPPQALANRRDVEQWLTGLDSPLRHGWRAAVLGPHWGSP